MRLAIVTTHPIQYYAPVFKLLQERQQIELKVFYTWGEAAIQKHDPGFGKTIEWDLPLLEGYPFDWVKNTASDPGSHHYRGIINPDLITQIELYQPDALMVYGWANQSHLKALRHFKNKLPVFFRGDSTLLDPAGKLKKFIKGMLLRWVYNHIDVALYVGDQNKAYFKAYGVKGSQLIFAPHAVDNLRFAENRSKEVQELRADLKISQEEVLILFAGKLDTKKDPELLLDAFQQLNKKNTHLLFVGNGVLEQPLKQKALQDARVHFLNFQNQLYMPVLYQACDLFCLPSAGPGETWGLVVNEAMACSKPVLASDKVGCAVDLVKNGYNGSVFQAQSVAALINQLELLISKGKDGLADMGAHSKKIIDDWTFQKQAMAIESAVIKHG